MLLFMLLIFSWEVLPVHAVVFHVALFLGSGNNAHGVVYAHGSGLLLTAGTKSPCHWVSHNYSGMF